MQIVEDDDERLRDGEELEQPPDGTMRAVALVRNDGAGAVPAPSHGWDDLRELVHELGTPRFVEIELLRSDVRIQRVDPDTEG